ncbi:Cytochrome b-c1 complex subunit 7 [Malassezia equina]|uniref:Complex III subunit 7 n=1 Tax=Malassezia equina TaxID=1381935 RepID=A0AAF0IZ01_9BASI|nr:Cytochrome b-c1 complex subunit 7 [Malassezia equina]
MASKSISLVNFIKSSPSLLKLVQPVANAYANAAGYRQMGLKYEDLIVEENQQMQKALSRLSEGESYDRAYRFRRAVQCSILQRDLPKEQWTKPEEAADDERAAWDTMKVVKKRYLEHSSQGLGIWSVLATNIAFVVHSGNTIYDYRIVLFYLVAIETLLQTTPTTLCQYVQIKPVLAVATVLLKIYGKYQDGRLHVSNGYTWIAMLYSMY